MVGDSEAVTLKRKADEQLGECLHLYIACVLVQDLLAIRIVISSGMLINHL